MRPLNRDQRNINSLSRHSAPDIDGWIQQARQLRFDIHQSQEEAHGVVEQARDGQRLKEEITDAASKIHLLEGELSFNRRLGVTLERLQALQLQLDLIHRAIVEEQLPQAVDLLESFDSEIASTTVSPNSRVVNVFSSRGTHLRNEVIERLNKCWTTYVHVDRDKLSIRIRGTIDGRWML